MGLGPLYDALYSSPRWHTYAGVWNDLDGIKTSVATSLSVQTYTGGALNGAQVAGFPLPFSQLLSVSTTSDAATYNVTDPIVFTITKEDGTVATVEVFLTDTDGNETVYSIVGACSVTSVALPAQLTTNGAFTFGFGDIVRENPFRAVRCGKVGGGTIKLGFQNGAYDSTPFLQAETQDVLPIRIYETGTDLPLTVYA